MLRSFDIMWLIDITLHLPYNRWSVLYDFDPPREVLCNLAYNHTEHRQQSQLCRQAWFKRCAFSAAAGLPVCRPIWRSSLPRGRNGINSRRSQASGLLSLIIFVMLSDVKPYHLTWPQGLPGLSCGLSVVEFTSWKHVVVRCMQCVLRALWVWWRY